MLQVLHSEGSDDWMLQIKYVQKRDNGTYECQVTNIQNPTHCKLRTCIIYLPSMCDQVSTGSGTLSLFVNLQIVVPEAFILGSDEHHVDAGSVINLVCIIEKVSPSPRPPSHSPRRWSYTYVVYAESDAASIRILVPQRAHDQLWQRTGCHRRYGTRS